jgi:histidinol-phosphate aminotransferase
MLPAKPHLKDIARVKNPTKSRYGFLRLDKNENTIAFPDSVLKEIQGKLTPEFLMVYPEIDSLYGRIAKWLNCEIENIYLSSGSDGAIKTVFEAFVQPGDTVMILDPTYAMFYVYIKLFQAKLSPIQYTPDLTLNKRALLEQIETQKPKLICIANPNSPTGTVFAQKDIEEIVSFCESRNIVTLIDEAYWLYYPNSALALISKYDNLVVTRSFSKAIGLAAVRLGLAAGGPQMIETLHKWRPMYETNAFAVMATEVVLNHFHLVEKNAQEVIEARGYLERELTRMDLGFHKSHANFMNIKVGDRERAAEILKLLGKDGILVSAAFNYEPLKDCIRVSIGNREQMDVFLKSFRQALKATEKI